MPCTLHFFHADLGEYQLPRTGSVAAIQTTNYFLFPTLVHQLPQ
jgi:hypothetical protein